ncbi:MAG: hypothetical protein AB8F26_11880 [Phycisphaerales bacterium]
MVVLRPAEVRFGSDVWDAVERVAIDRVGTRVIREESDDGGGVVFVDVPERMVRAKVWQLLDQTTLDGPEPGEFEEVRIELGTGADEGSRLIRFDAVIESVTHQVSGSRATRVISLIAVSDQGDTDPVTMTSLD